MRGKIQYLQIVIKMGTNFIGQIEIYLRIQHGYKLLDKEGQIIKAHR